MSGVVLTVRRTALGRWLVTRPDRSDAVYLPAGDAQTAGDAATVAAMEWGVTGVYSWQTGPSSEPSTLPDLNYPQG